MDTIELHGCVFSPPPPWDWEESKRDWNRCWRECTKGTRSAHKQIEKIAHDLAEKEKVMRERYDRAVATHTTGVCMGGKVKQYVHYSVCIALDQAMMPDAYINPDHPYSLIFLGEINESKKIRLWKKKCQH